VVQFVKVNISQVGERFAEGRCSAPLQIAGRATGNPAPDADGQSCRNECNWRAGDKPPLGWRIHADKLLRT